MKNEKGETGLFSFLRFIVLVSVLCAAAPALGGESETATVERLLQDLRSANYEKAWAAARDLGGFPRERGKIVPTLLEALQRDWPQCSGDIREAVGVSLGQLAGKEAVFPLLELLKSGKNIAHECAECGCCFLALTPGDVVAERTFDPFCENRVLATINELADVSHSKAMADLVTAGAWKPELLITIGKVGLPRYAHFIAKQKDDPQAAVRIGVARGLGLIDNAQVAVPVLIQYVGKTTEEFLVRWEAANSLIAIGKRGKEPALQGRLAGLMREPDPWTGVLAARALAHLGDPVGSLRLRGLVADADAKIRAEALLALGEVADAGALGSVTPRLEDESLAVRATAMYALGRTGDASHAPMLDRALEAALRYQAELEARQKSGASEATLRQQLGFGVFDLRQTHQEALAALQRRKP
jgi:HEAT repeat protein